MKKAIIFDLDGTLLNTILDLGEACNVALSYYGYPTHSLDRYPHLVGNGVNKLIERALPAEFRNEKTILQLREVFISYYNDHKCVHTHPYKGIEATIQALKNKGYGLAVASNKYNTATQTLVTHYFGDLFDIVYGEREGVERKPNPQIVYDIMKELGVRADEVLYVGDSDVDMQTARNAGTEAVGCTWGFCSRDILTKENPKYLIDHPEQLLDIIH